MGKKLIIAEKPSLARNIAAAIPGIKKKTDGVVETDQYIITSAFGHLLELKDAEDYDEDLKKWSLDTLPIVPEPFKYKIKDDAGCKKQMNLIASLLDRADVDAVVNAGDSDREGEIIIRNILRFKHNQKPVYRLWMPDQTPQTIAAELASMKLDSEYDNLANEGYTRTKIDWLYGINLTRLATIKSKLLLRVGRVTSPIVQAICERERAILNFVPVPYYVATHVADTYQLASESKCETIDECDAQCKEYNKLPLIVIDKTSKTETITRPKLFSLSDLQGVCGKQFKFAPKETLDIVQTLYEQGYVSYPRTNSRYMATAEKQKAKDIIKALQNASLEYAGIDFRDSKMIFDDSKIESHSALTPTYKIANVSSLKENERKVYTTIVNRFCAVFCAKDEIVEKTTIVFDNGKEKFKLTGTIVKQHGFSAFESTSKKDVELPPLNKGDKVEPNFKRVDKKTLPPDHYTADSLNAYLKAPYAAKERKALEDDEELKEVLGEVELGTEATRAGLIDSAIKSGYITFESNRYGITELGEYYVDTLSALGVDMTKDRTLDLSKSLKQVFHGIGDMDAVVQDAVNDIRSIVYEGKSKNGARISNNIQALIDKRYGNKGDKGHMKSGVAKQALCKCPKCGKNVYEYPQVYRCEDRDCKVVLFKESKFFEKYKTKMTASQAKTLLTKGRVPMKGLVSPKTNKKFEADVVVVFEGDYPQFSFDFTNNKKK